MMASSSRRNDRLAVCFRQAGSCDRAVESLARQPGLDHTAKLEQRLDSDAGIEADRLEKKHAVLGIDVAARAWREGTASQPRERRIEPADAHVHRGGHVGEPGPAWIVGMNG